jgi:hypothetical protein
VVDLHLKVLRSEGQRLWAECRLKGLARGTPQRNRLEELDKLLSEHRNKSGGLADGS